MKSDLANSVKDVALPDQDDRFLVTHYLAGQHEIEELSNLREALEHRQREAEAIHNAIAETLRERHVHGKNFTIGKALLQIPAKTSKARLTISTTEVLPP